MRRRNFVVMGIGIPLSLIVCGVSVLAFYLSLIFGIAISINGNEIVADLLLYSSFTYMFAGIIGLIGSIITGFFSIPGGIMLLLSSLISTINPIFMITSVALYSESFPFTIILFLLPAIFIFPFGIWAICTKPKPKKQKENQIVTNDTSANQNQNTENTTLENTIQNTEGEKENKIENIEK